jgi:predicted ATP-dependent endonuclease of OLD family
MSVKINRLEIENLKRVKAVMIEPTENGLTVIGGKNNQGKTSVLDAIAWALGGDKYKPSEPRRDGSVTPPGLRVELSNGIIVERKGKNADLKVIDSLGNKSGQQLLNEFIAQLALDLPKFMESNNREKAQVLLKVIGVGDKLYELERAEQELYNQRRAVGQIADQKKKFAEEMRGYPDAPQEPVSASELIRQQQDILARNGENRRKRERAEDIERSAALLDDEIKKVTERLSELTEKQRGILSDLETAKKSAADLYDESTEELEKNIADIEEINRRVRANLDKAKAEADADEYIRQYAGLTEKIDGARQSRTDLLTGANLPLHGLSVDGGELTYKGYKWDNMSGSDQLKVSAAIVRKLNPNCGFVLLDKLEQMDTDTLSEFGAWLESEGLQAIATRVSTGGECSVIIEDGYASTDTVKSAEAEKKEWKAGNF